MAQEQQKASWPPEHPKRADYPSEEHYLEAVSAWRHTFGRVLPRPPRSEGSPPNEADQRRPPTAGPLMPARDSGRQGSAKPRPRAKKPKVPLDDASRQRLVHIAQRGLEKTRHGEEQWSFLSDSEGYVWCPWVATAEEEYDGDPSLIADQLPPERLEELEDSPAAKLTDAELALWRRAKCTWYAGGTDWAWLAWVVSVSDEGSGCEGFALFTSEPEGDPVIVDVFASLEEAKSYLHREGAVGR